MGIDFFETDEGFEVSMEFAEENAEKLRKEGIEVYIVERYPTYNRLLISKTPLR